MIQQTFNALALEYRSPPINGRSRTPKSDACLIRPHLLSQPESTHPKTHSSQLRPGRGSLYRTAVLSCQEKEIWSFLKAIAS